MEPTEYPQVYGRNEISEFEKLAKSENNQAELIRIRKRKNQFKSYDKRKGWEETMTPDEVQWCLGELIAMDKEVDYPCTDSYRAARIWKSSQVRRFKRLRTCCGSHEWTSKRWNWGKLRFDKYLFGFNYGH